MKTNFISLFILLIAENSKRIRIVSCGSWRNEIAASASRPQHLSERTLRLTGWRSLECQNPASGHDKILERIDRRQPVTGRQLDDHPSAPRVRLAGRPEKPKYSRQFGSHLGNPG